MNKKKKKNSKRGGARPGAGRKPTTAPNKKPKTLGLDLDTHRALDALKKSTGKSQAVIVESLVKKAEKDPGIIE